MTFTEILETIARKTNTQNSTTSSYTTAQKTLDVNNALNWYFVMANSSANNWRPVDDTNQTDYPIVYADIVSGQQDYSFTTDENGNQILDIYKVRIKDATTGEWTTLEQINQDTITDGDLSVINSGVPYQYYLNSNGIFLVQKPNFNLTDGLEIWVNRTSTYFTVNDTTKKAGIPWVHHEYLALRPSYFYCLDKGLPQATELKRTLYGDDGRSGMEGAIQKYYRDRNKAFQQNITSEYIDSI
jgi:hypothetical protein